MLWNFVGAAMVFAGGVLLGIGIEKRRMARALRQMIREVDSCDHELQ